MAFNLARLLGLQSAVAEVPPIQGDPADVINVTAPLPQETAGRPPTFDLPERPAVDPRYVLNDARITPNEQELQELLPRQGMFGVKGTLRDVLGALGDAFLVQSGNERVYAPRRQQERVGDAMFGFTQNPLQAIERLATVDPEAARQVQEAYQEQLLRQAQQESLAASRQSVDDARRLARRETGLDRVSRWVAGGLRYDLLVNAAKEYDITQEELTSMGITPNMSDEERAAFASGDMSVYNQRQIPLREQQLDISQQNADTARISANRPRPVAQPRSETSVEFLQRLMNIPPSQRTPEEQAYVERNTQPSDSGNRRRPAPPSTSSRFGPPRR